MPEVAVEALYSRWHKLSCLTEGMKENVQYARYSMYHITHIM